MKKSRKPAALGCTNNARSAAQAAHMAKTTEQGTCPFCKFDWKINTLVKEGRFWLVILNAFKYPYHRNHLLIVPKRHVTDITALTPEERAEWWRLNLWAMKEFKMPGGGLVFRFGKFEYNAGTISHLHSHVQVPNKKGFAIAVFCKDEKLQAFFASLGKANHAAKKKAK